MTDGWIWCHFEGVFQPKWFYDSMKRAVLRSIRKSRVMQQRASPEMCYRNLSFCSAEAFKWQAQSKKLLTSRLTMQSIPSGTELLCMPLNHQLCAFQQTTTAKQRGKTRQNVRVQFLTTTSPCWLTQVLPGRTSWQLWQFHRAWQKLASVCSSAPGRMDGSHCLW